jgi:hypothetical protein
MIIDISTTSYTHLSYRDVYRVKGNKLLTELNRINIKMSVKHNYIIIPMTVYNILEYNDNFISVVYSPKGDGPVLVGSVGEFDCYLDIHLPANEIIVSWDKQTSRDVKLESILNGISEKEKRVKILS